MHGDMRAMDVTNCHSSGMAKCQVRSGSRDHQVDGKNDRPNAALTNNGSMPVRDDRLKGSRKINTALTIH